MSPIDNDVLLHAAVESAIAASHIIMDALDSPRVADFKGKTDLVTETDHRSEKTIKSILKSSFPEHSFLAEESGEEATSSDYLWIIDPLDGTTNFVHGYPSFAVSIGLYHQNYIRCRVSTHIKHLSQRLLNHIKMFQNMVC